MTALQAACAEYQEEMKGVAALAEFDAQKDAYQLELAAEVKQAQVLTKKPVSMRGRVGARYVAKGKSINGFRLSAGSGQIDTFYMAHKADYGEFPTYEVATEFLSGMGLTQKDIEIHVRYYQKHRGLYLNTP